MSDTLKGEEAAMEQQQEAAIEMTEPTSVAVVEREPVPEPFALLTRPGNFQSYMERLWKSAHEEIDKAVAAVDEKTRELEEISERIARLTAQSAQVDDGGRQVALARGQVQGARTRLTRALRAQKQAVAFRDALGVGYVPLPRMPAVNLRFVQEIMPHDVLDAMEEASAAGVFEEFRLVTGEDANARGWPTGRKLEGRDPILVGVIGREIFAVAWWR